MSYRSARLGGLTMTRTFPLDDIRVRSGGDGRTVEAYAAVFNTPSEVRDQDGHYNEQIAPSAFNRTLKHRGTDFRVFYNHGMTLHGTPSERHSMPLGTPLEVRADAKGLLTVTRYNKTPLADDVLEAINNGDIRGQSFTGRMIQSDPARGPHRARGGQLPMVTRSEIGLIEYGPTPLPVYGDAAILGVRALQLADTDVMLLQLILDGLAEGDAALDPIVDALTKTDQALDAAQAVLAQILSEPNPDADDAEPAVVDDPQRATYLSRLSALATRLDAVSAGAPGTPDAGLASESSDSVAPKLTRAQVRARLYRKGLL